jgi:hypothetical protein
MRDRAGWNNQRAAVGARSGLQLTRRYARGSRRRVGARGAPEVHPASAAGDRAPGAWPRWPGSHRAQEGLQWRHGCRGPRPALAALPPRRSRPPHRASSRTLLRGSRPRIKMAPAHRTRSSYPRPRALAPPDPTHPDAPQSRGQPPDCPPSGSRYRPWAKPLERTFGIDVEICPRCCGRIRLMAIITDLSSAACLLRQLGEPTEPHGRTTICEDAYARRPN